MPDLTYTTLMKNAKILLLELGGEIVNGRIVFTREGVIHSLRFLKAGKACGPDRLRSVLKW